MRGLHPIVPTEPVAGSYATRHDEVLPMRRPARRNVISLLAAGWLLGLLGGGVGAEFVQAPVGSAQRRCVAQILVAILGHELPGCQT